MAETVQILDTTLRDGNRLPFVVLDLQDRLFIARQLAALGVDIIDAGYPAASREERESVTLIAREVTGPCISALSRAIVEDVRSTCELLRASEKPHLHIFLHCSEHFRTKVLKLSRQEYLQLIHRCLQAAAEAGVPAQFSLGEIGEAEPGFLLEACQAVGEGGARVLNLADTNGTLHPGAMTRLLTGLREGLSAFPGLILGVHCHNDLGLATANTLAALQAGVRHVEATIGGVGGRSGNAPLEEIVFTLEALSESLGLEHHIQLDRLARTAGLLSRLSGIPIHPNKPVIGKYAFHEARGPEARSSLPPRLRDLFREETVGRSLDGLFGEQEMSMAGFSQQLSALQVDTTGVNLEKVYQLYKAQVRRKRTVTLSEIQAMVEETRLQAATAYELSAFSVMTGSSTLPVGSVELRKGVAVLVQTSQGSGPVDALCRAVDRAIGFKPRLLQYAVDLLTEGKDARTEITVTLAYLGRTFHGHSGSTDVVEASLRAYLDAVNSIEAYRQSAPEEEFYIDGAQLWWE
jgi:2-isopropylmalate synthase